ncbi:hypothetical protein AVEN_155092-1 [Araneus ventricosus]|uniref:Uncharacterized protein n=1 Tax=Araneus ventricosus TaxID=182803 RepID=A0A4Y2A7K0_ARAVE|nr:hypothetical protein AVEN_155092-1 [Araneus ventricosus]
MKKGENSSFSPKERERKLFLLLSEFEQPRCFGGDGLSYREKGAKQILSVRCGYSSYIYSVTFLIQAAGVNLISKSVHVQKEPGTRAAYIFHICTFSQTKWESYAVS